MTIRRGKSRGGDKVSSPAGASGPSRDRILFERANDAIVIFEPEDETILDANPRACEIYGRSHDELVGMSVKSLTRDVARGEQQIRELLAAGSFRDFESVHLRSDGTPIYFLINSSVIDHDGRPAILSINRDISDRKRAEDALRESESRFHALTEVAPVGIFRTDADGNTNYVNPRWCEIAQLDPDEAMGDGWLAAVHPDDRDGLAERWRQASAALSPSRAEYRFLRPDGSVAWVIGLSAPHTDHTGEVRGYIGAITDITESRRLEEQLRQSQKMEAVGRLAGGVAHDFNNLLQAMLSQVQRLRSRPGDTSRVESLAAELEEQLVRGASLTRQLLLFSRRETVKPELLDLSRGVHESIRLLRRLIPANIELAVELCDRRLPVMVDKGQLAQVAMNLAVNAVDAMPEGGRLTVRTGELAGEQVWLEVTDTGIGIPDSIMTHIFDPFFTTKANDKGTGLGLAVVHGIATGHGGRIDVASGVGVGTTIRVILPRAVSTADHGPAEVSSSMTDLPMGRGERVLLVEDEDGAREGLCDMLAMLGYDVVGMASGEEAVQLPVDQPFDVLVTDLMLPGIAGPTLAKDLVLRWPELRVILMSGYTEDEAIRQGVAALEVRFLQKPFGMAALAREIRAAVEGDPRCPPSC